MKSLMILVLAMFGFNAFALSPKLDPAVKMVKACLETEQVLLCNQEITTVLKSVHMDARGEFVYFLKDVLNKNENEKTISNLYVELQKLVPVYEQLDGCDQWSCRDLKVFLGDVSVRMVKVAPIKADLLSELYAKQAVQSSRYNLLTTIHGKADKLNDLADFEEVIKFAEFAKEHSRKLGDEFYLYESGVNLIKKMTSKILKVRVNFEGVYSVKFMENDVADKLAIDSVVIMKSGERDGLVVNFVSSKLRMVRFSFKSAGILGNKVFSNQDVYENRPDISAPYFSLVLDHTNKTVEGSLSAARTGKASFDGDLVLGNAQIMAQDNVKGLTLDMLAGSSKVMVGNYAMTLTIKKRTDERELYEASLVNANALIVFSKVELDVERGVLSLVDWKNERKLTLGVTALDNGKLEVKGVFMNAPLAKVLDVQSL